jgi:hypothetical protein
MKPFASFQLPVRRQMIGALLGSSLLLLQTASVLAHEGHDHGGPAAAPLPAAPATSKFVATSEDFEVVGVLSSEALTLYLDDARTNQPIDGAVLEVVADGQSRLSAKAEQRSPGTYRLALKSALPPGTYALTLGIDSTQGSDLLTAKLVHSPAAAEGARPPEASPLSWKPLAGGVLILVVGGVAVSIIKRRRASQRWTEKSA